MNLFWLIIDYIWLCIGLFAVIMAVLEIDRLHKRQDLEKFENSLNSEFVTLQGSVKHNAYYTKNKWFIQCDKILDLGSQNAGWKHFLYQNSRLINPDSGSILSPEREPEQIKPSDYLYKSAQDIVKRLSIYAQGHDKLDRMKQEIFASESVPKYIRIFLVIVFIFVFGLRITRATVDYRNRTLKKEGVGREKEK